MSQVINKFYRKIQYTTVTMKIGYFLIESPFKYHVSYLNGNLDGNVPDMSLGWGHVKKSQGQNQMAGHIFDRIFSVTCPLRVPRVSHVSDTLKNTKKKRTQINQIFRILIWTINSIPQ